MLNADSVSLKGTSSFIPEPMLQMTSRMDLVLLSQVLLSPES